MRSGREGGVGFGEGCRSRVDQKGMVKKRGENRTEGGKGLKTGSCWVLSAVWVLSSIGI